jgi:hypothetical protein
MYFTVWYTIYSRRHSQYTGSSVTVFESLIFTVASIAKSNAEIYVSKLASPAMYSDNQQFSHPFQQQSKVLVVFLIVFENEEPNIKNGLMLSISYACT